MADTYVPGGMVFGEDNTNIRKAYWDDIVDDTFLERRDLTSLLVMMGKTEYTPDFDVNWMSYKERARYVTPTANTAVGTATPSVVTVSSDDYLKLAKGNILFDYSTSCGYYLSDTNTSESGTALTTSQFHLYKINPSGTATQAITLSALVGHKLYVDGTTIKDGWADIANVGYYISSKQIENFQNYVADVTEFTKLTEYSLNMDREARRNKRMEELDHATQRLRDRLEIQLFRSVGGSPNTIGSDSIYFTKGIENFTGIGAETGTVASYTWKDFRDFLSETVMNWNKKNRMFAFCNKAFMNKVDDWVSEESDLSYPMTGGQNGSFGYGIRTLESSVCTLELHQNTVLTDAIPAEDAVLYVLDLDRIKLRYWNGDKDNFNITYHLDPDEREDREHRRFIADEVSCKYCVQTGSPVNHSVLKLAG